MQPKKYNITVTNLYFYVEIDKLIVSNFKGFWKYYLLEYKSLKTYIKWLEQFNNIYTL